MKISDIIEKYKRKKEVYILDSTLELIREIIEDLEKFKKEWDL